MKQAKLFGEGWIAEGHQYIGEASVPINVDELWRRGVCESQEFTPQIFQQIIGRRETWDDEFE